VTEVEQNLKHLRKKRREAEEILRAEDLAGGLIGAVTNVLPGTGKRDQILGSLKNVQASIREETARAAREYLLELRAFTTAHPEVDPE
jgi:hypothetical protein